MILAPFCAPYLSLPDGRVYGRIFRAGFCAACDAYAHRTGLNVPSAARCAL